MTEIELCLAAVSLVISLVPLARKWKALSFEARCGLAGLVLCDIVWLLRLVPAVK
jgi:hypothetical protein